MGHWYQKILSEFVIGIKPITIVVDPDHLLAEENIIAKLNDRRSLVVNWLPRKGFLEVDLPSGKYRIIRDNGLYVAQKQTAKGKWRYDHRSRNETLVNVVAFVESKA